MDYLPVFDINYWAVLVAAIAANVIGMLWYSPALFGKPWLKLLGMTEEKMAQAKAGGMGKKYAVNFIASLVMAYILDYFLQVWGAVGVSGAFQVTLWLWLGFIATVMLGTILWEGKTVKLYAINVFYYLVSIFVMSLILVFWM
jgi:hypothetical protein